MPYSIFFGMVFAHTARAIGPWQKGVTEVFCFVNGNFVHTHSLLVGEALLALRARPVNFNWGRTDL